MRSHLNTLFVTLEGAYLRKDGAAVDVRHEKQTKLRVPLHNLDGIVCFGWNCTASASLMGACAEADVALSFHNSHGKFLAASQGFTSGNILRQRAQYRAADLPEATLAIAKNIIAGKIHNSRHVLLHAARDHGGKDAARAEKLLSASDQLTRRIRYASAATELDGLRGVEDDSATYYFAAFPAFFSKTPLPFDGRNRRPPTDPVNALLSFLYSLLTHDCRPIYKHDSSQDTCAATSTPIRRFSPAKRARNASPISYFKSQITLISSQLTQPTSPASAGDAAISNLKSQISNFKSPPSCIS